MSVEEELQENDEKQSVVEYEERFRELREQATTPSTDKKPEPPEDAPTIQNGVIRDCTGGDGYQDECVFTVETEYDVIDVSVPVPSEEYSLDNDVVMLMEWKNIPDGRVGDLIGETVYVNTQQDEFVVPSSLSPVARAVTHATARFDGIDVPFGPAHYLIAMFLSCFTGMAALPVLFGLDMSASATPYSLAVIVGWILVLGPLVKLLVTPLLTGGARRVWQAWKNRYHEV